MFGASTLVQEREKEVVERDENGAYLKIPLISPLAAAYKHQACKYCNSFECPPKKMCEKERDFWLVDSKK